MTRRAIRIATPELNGSEPLSDITAFAQAAEAAGFDVLRLKAAPGLDALSVACALIGSTQRIGLSAAVWTGVGEPYTVARGLAALDHLSGGRAVWEVLAGTPDALPPYAHRPQTDPADAAARAAEFIDAVSALWDSWAPDALLQDKAEARFARPDRIRAVNFTGRHVHSRGPLNTPRPPQGRLPILCDAEAPIEVQTRADLVISTDSDLEVCAPLSALETLTPALQTDNGAIVLRARLGLPEITSWA